MSIFEAWTKYRQYLLPAIEQTNGTHTEDDILLALLHGRLKIWCGTKSAIVTELVTYPRLKAVNCFLGGGDLAELILMEKDIVIYAKSEGCSRVTGGGRFGWKRVLTDYIVSGTYMYKDIEN